MSAESDVSAAQVWAQVPQWYKTPQGADVPSGAKKFGRRHDFNMPVVIQGEEANVHVVSARIRSHSQNPKLEISPIKRYDSSVVFTLETSKFTFACEGDDRGYEQFFEWFRANVPAVFMFKNKANCYEACIKAMVVIVEVDTGKSPTIIGFPDSTLDTRQDESWNALKSVTGGSFLSLWMPADTGHYEALKNTMSVISSLAPVVKNFGSYWYRRYQSPSSPDREAPKWLFGINQPADFQIYETMRGEIGAFIDHHERECRLVDGSWLELRGQQAQLERVFNLERTHKASFESLGRDAHCLNVTVVGSVSPPNIQQGTVVKFLFNAKAPVEVDFFRDQSIIGKALERRSPQEFSVLFTGQPPLNLAAGKVFDVVLKVVPDTTAMKRQIDALQNATNATIPGDMEDGNGKGVSLQRTILSHRVEMDPKSVLYFELNFQQFSPLEPAELNSRFATIKSLWEKELDPTQRQAVKQSVERIVGGLSLIEGPPGYGKTYAAVHILVAALMLNVKVLLTAATNKAVDNTLAVLRRFYEAHPELARASFGIVRLRAPEVQIACFGSNDDSGGTMRNIADAGTQIIEWEAHNRVIEFAKKCQSEKAIAAEASKFLKLRSLHLQGGLSGEQLSKYKELYSKILNRLLASSSLVATTLNNAGAVTNTGFHPVVMVCDEAGQCREGDTMIGMLHDSLRAAVLIGDPQQLAPPLIPAHEHNEQSGFLMRSLLSRLVQSGYKSTRLTVNYKNHPDIVNFFKRQVYQGDTKTGKPQDAPERPRLEAADDMDIDEDVRLQEELKAAEEKAKELKEQISQRQRDRACRQ